MAPVYILYGEEGYFIDELVKAFESLIPEADRAFNLYSFYAHQIQPEVVVSTCMKYPMFCDRQVVILRECQSVDESTLNKMAGYVAAPNKSTVLVFCYRGETAKGASLKAAAKKNGAVIFESKRLSDANADSVIMEVVKEKGLNIEQKGLAMLREFIGTDVAKMYNEVNKMALVLGPGATITPESIERNVGISKDYNNSELIEALSRKDATKVFKIVKYFRSNPKKNPPIMTVAFLFNYFSNLTIAVFAKDKSPEGLMQALNMKWKSGISQYQTGMKHYNAWQVLDIITALRQFDAQSKGIGSRQDQYDLLHDLMFRILTTTGR